MGEYLFNEAMYTAINHVIFNGPYAETPPSQRQKPNQMTHLYRQHTRQRNLNAPANLKPLLGTALFCRRCTMLMLLLLITTPFHDGRLRMKTSCVIERTISLHLAGVQVDVCTLEHIPPASQMEQIWLKHADKRSGGWIVRQPATGEMVSPVG